jgi:hypothetical protein
LQVQQDSGTLLRERIATLRLPLTPSAKDGLRGAVCTYVDELKALGWLPERVIVAVKQLAREAGLKSSAWKVLTSTPNTASDNLLVEVVGWCIERYYFRPE